MTAELDGIAGEGEWSKAAVYSAAEGSPFTSFAYGMDQENLFIKVELAKLFGGNQSVEVYLNAAGDQERQMTQLGGGRLLAPASRVLEVKAGQNTVELYLTDGETWTLQEEAVGRAAVSGSTIELELPKSVLGEAGNGNMIPMQVVLRDKEAVLLNEDAPLAI